MKLLQVATVLTAASIIMVAGNVKAQYNTCYVNWVDTNNPCATFNGCIASCSETTCSYDGLPINLYLGIYAYGTVYQPAAYASYDESGSMGTVNATPGILIPA